MIHGIFRAVHVTLRRSNGEDRKGVNVVRRLFFREILAAIHGNTISGENSEIDERRESL